MDRDSPHWILLVGSHLARSVVNWSQRDSLETEIIGLRIEVQRTRDLVSGFNQVLESCESSNFWLRLANKGLLFIWILGLFALLGAGYWWFAIRGKSVQPCKIELPVPSAPPALTAHPVRTGPVRPSDLARSREER